ncbi:hypothetical protein Tco_1184893 [Tanacetum coccineum]
MDESVDHPCVGQKLEPSRRSSKSKENPARFVPTERAMQTLDETNVELLANGGASIATVASGMGRGGPPFKVDSRESGELGVAVINVGGVLTDRQYGPLVTDRRAMQTLDGKLNPRYVGPFKVIERVETVAYKLELPQQLSRVHNTFHVPNLKKCLSDESLVIPLEELRVDDNLYFIEEPVEVMNREIKQLK